MTPSWAPTCQAGPWGEFNQAPVFMLILTHTCSCPQMMLLGRSTFILIIHIYSCTQMMLLGKSTLL